MYTHVQRIRWSREQGEFTLEVTCQIPSVVNEVRDRLEKEYSGQAGRILNLVWQESHPEHSVLVVTPVDSSAKHLEIAMFASMQRHLRDVLAERAVSRAG